MATPHFGIKVSAEAEKAMYKSEIGVWSVLSLLMINTVQ